MSKNSMKKRCREILKSKVISLDDDIFLRDVLQTHKDYEKKLGCGIDSFFIGKTIYQNYGFFIKRKDGTSTDFSYLSCLDKRGSNFYLKKASREAINKDIYSVKTDKSKQIHHEGVKFNEIFEFWYKMNKDRLDMTLNESKDNSQITKFANEETAKDFREFHKKVADLEEISVDEHKIKHSTKEW